MRVIFTPSRTIKEGLQFAGLQQLNKEVKPKNVGDSSSSENEEEYNPSGHTLAYSYELRVMN